MATENSSVVEAGRLECGKKLVYRLYKEEGLTLRHKPRRNRRAALHRRERFRPTSPMKWGVWILWLTNWRMDDGFGL
jgi:putative transposase